MNKRLMAGILALSLAFAQIPTAVYAEELVPETAMVTEADETEAVIPATEEIIEAETEEVPDEQETEMPELFPEVQDAEVEMPELLPATAAVRLNPPGDPHWDGNLIRWNEVPNAGSYEIKVTVGDNSDNSETHTTTGNYYDLGEILEQLGTDYCSKNGKANAPIYASIIAKSGNLEAYADSQEMLLPEKLYIMKSGIKLGMTSNIAWNETTHVLRWDPVKNASKYEVLLNVGLVGSEVAGQKAILTTTGTSMDLSEQVLELTVRLCAAYQERATIVYASVRAISENTTYSNGDALAAPVLKVNYGAELPSLKKANVIEAKDIERTYYKYAQTFSLGATNKWKTAMTYISHDPSVKVTSAGKVTLPAKFVGVAHITIRSVETDDYEKSEKTIAITVKPILTVKDLVKNASAYHKTYSVGATVKGNASLTYLSDNNEVSVSPEGQISVPARFVGIVHIQVKASAPGGVTVTKTITLTVNALKENTITVPKDKLVYSYAGKKRTVKLGAKALGKAKLTYSSDNPSIKVSSSGTVTFPKGVVGSATITITSAETTVYYPATIKVHVQQDPVDNVIKVSNKATTSRTTERILSMSAKALGGAKLTYEVIADNAAPVGKGVTITADGKIHIPGNYVGTAQIRITTGAAPGYNPVQKVVTVSVTLPKPTLSIYNVAVDSIRTKWKNVAGTEQYVVQISATKYFESDTFTTYVIDNPETLTFLQKVPARGYYYVRVKAQVTRGGEVKSSPWSKTHGIRVKK